MSQSNPNSVDDVVDSTRNTEASSSGEGEHHSNKNNSIATLLKSSGPVVKCVLLKHMRSSGRDVHPHVDQSIVAQKIRQYKHDNSTIREKEEGDDYDDNKKPAADVTTATTTNLEENAQHHREVLTELIEEIEIDTSPGMNGVENVLGGNGFTFVGQYPDEGVVLMARADQFHEDIDEIDSLSIRELKSIVRDNPDMMSDIDLTTVTDKADLIQAVKNTQLPINPHRLQPPFNDCTIRGDLLIMRVADNIDKDDDDDEDDPATAMSQAIKEITTATAIPNDEFFLDYTKDEYVTFASRTDIVAPPMEDLDEFDDDDDDDIDENDDDQEGDDNEEGTIDDDDDDDDDDEYTADDVGDEEDDKRVLLSLILGEVIKSFRQKNGRGPDSEELLDLRAQVAEKLNYELAPPAPQIPEDDLKKRKSIGDGCQQSLDQTPSPKKVKFTAEILDKADENDNDGIDTSNEVDEQGTMTNLDDDGANDDEGNDNAAT